MISEWWNPIPAWPGYEVSSHGRVRSVDRVLVISGKPRRYKGRVLAQFADSSGYRYITVRVDGKRSTRLVHALVLEAFVGPCPPGLECCHNDGDSTNNHASNLRWDTREANMADLRKHGRDPRLNRKVCSRGHRLEQPNLDPRQLSMGKRWCKACRNAHVKLTKRRRAGHHVEDRQAALQELADRSYARISAQAGWLEPVDSML